MDSPAETPQASPKAVVEEVYRRYAGGDLDGALALLSPGVSHRACPNSAGHHFCGIYDGIDAVRSRMLEIIGTFAFTRFAPDWIIAEGDTVAARVAMVGTVRATGVPLDTSVTHTFRVAGGLIVEFEEFFDSTYIDAVVGSDAA